MDFLKKAFGNKAAPENLPRFHHYVFVHTILKDLFFENGVQLIEVFGSPTGRQTLINLWEKVGSDIEGDELLPSENMDVKNYKKNDFEICLIQLPQPEKVTEAYYIALISGPQGKYYYTLEHTYGPDPVICFWENDTHGNTGKHIKADGELFVNSVIESIDKKTN